jgi:hypothetical protein
MAEQPRNPRFTFSVHIALRPGRSKWELTGSQRRRAYTYPVPAGVCGVESSAQEIAYLTQRLWRLGMLGYIGTKGEFCGACV